METTPKKPKKTWFQEKYRLVVVNDNTFQEKGSLNLTPRNLVVLGVGILLGLGLLIFLLSRWIGGAPPRREGNTGEQLAFIYEQLDSLEKELVAKDTYIENMRRLVVGDFEREKDVEKKGPSKTENKPIEEVPFPEKNAAVDQVVKTAEYEKELGSLVTSAFAEDMSASEMRFVCPLKGVVSDTFSVPRKHFGTDIVAPKGSVIKSVQQGTVIMANWTAEEGHTIGIQHSGNLISFYKHNSSLLKKMGDIVRAGEAIAIIGNTGERTSGPHLHFELWYNGSPANPQKYIKF